MEWKHSINKIMGEIMNKDKLLSLMQETFDEYSELLEADDTISLQKKEFPNGVQTGDHWNAHIWVKDDCYRERVDVLIFDNMNRIFLLEEKDKKKNNRIDSQLKEDVMKADFPKYRFPGGSLERNKTIEEVGKMETMEEAGLVVSSVKRTNISYISEVDWKKDILFRMIEREYGLKLSGFYTHILTARYNGKNSITDLEDEDSDMFKYGKWYEIKDVLHILNDAHIKALKESFYIKENLDLKDIDFSRKPIFDNEDTELVEVYSDWDKERVIELSRGEEKDFALIIKRKNLFSVEKTDEGYEFPKVRVKLNKNYLEEVQKEFKKKYDLEVMAVTYKATIEDKSILGKDKSSTILLYCNFYNGENKFINKKLGFLLKNGGPIAKEYVKNITG